MNKFRYLLSDKLIVNFLHIFGGDAFASLLSIFSISFITKGLGLDKYGFIVLIQGIVGLVDGIFNFQSWQGVIKFFPEVNREREKLNEMLRFSYFVDIVTAFLTFTILLLGSTWIGNFYNFSESERKIFLFFSIYVLFNIQGTAIGILRSFDKFDYLRNQRVIVAIFNFVILGLGFLLKKNLLFFVGAYFATNVLNGLILNYMAFKILKNLGIGNIFKGKLKFNREFFKFTCLTNINSSLDIPVQYLDNLLVGKLLSLEQLGIYKICKTIAIVLDKIGSPIYQTLYPYFCEKIVHKEYKEVFKKSFKIGGILFVICFFILLGMNTIGFTIVSKFFSQGILNYKLPINFYLLLKSIATVFIVVHPLFLAMGYIKIETRIIFTANLVYLIVLFFLIKKFALIGVIFSYGIQVVLIVTLKLIYLFSHHREIFRTCTKIGQKNN